MAAHTGITKAGLRVAPLFPPLEASEARLPGLRLEHRSLVPISSSDRWSFVTAMRVAIGTHERYVGRLRKDLQL